MSEILLFNSFGKGKKQAVTRKGTDCVIYTRVSSKEQAENLSLLTQLKACTVYADKQKYNIVSTFGVLKKALRPMNGRNSLQCWHF